MVGLPRGQHRFWRSIIPGAGSGRRDTLGAIRFHQRLLGHPGHRPDHLPGGLAHQPVRGALRRGHGFADPWRGLWLYRLDRHLADLRQLHLHLLRARGRHHGLRTRVGLGRATRMGLPDLRAGRDSTCHPRRLGHQSFANVDATAVAGPTHRAFRFCVHAQPWCVF
jgi:hypothetical protein